MKNPMTLQQKHQALDDVNAGKPMQYRPFHSGNHSWLDCVDTERSLNFMVNEYRRKPEQLVRYVIADHDDGNTWVRKTLCEAFDLRNNKPRLTIHKLVEDTDWVEPKPAMPEKNPWRPIARGEWPKCKPSSEIELEYGNNNKKVRTASRIQWDLTKATRWRYEEDEE